METDYRPGSLQIAYATTPSAVGDHRITRVRVTNVIAARGDLHNLSIGDVVGEFAMPLHKHMLPVLVKDAVCLVACIVVLSLTMPDLSRADATVVRLKSAYLDCENAAVNRALNAGEIARCTIIYEKLKGRVFGGDFRRLKAWFEAERDRRPAGLRSIDP
jgi:hypothetical protein